MKLTLRGFGGLYPKVAPELLQDSAASVATNCFLENGDVQPMRASDKAYTTFNASNITTFYRAENDPTAISGAWLTWGTDVDVARQQFLTDYRYYWTGSGAPKVSTMALATTGFGDNYPAASRTLGVAKPAPLPTVTPPAGGTPVTRFYCYTFVTDWGEEGPASDPSAIQTGDIAGTWAISAMQANPANTTKRLYRTEGTSAQWQLVAEGITGTTFNDNLTTANIPGDELISTTWEAPPAGLKGLVAHPAGFMVGFLGTEVYISEPYQPHAYPPEYRKRVEHNIIGIGIAGTAIVIATASAPYLCLGEPGSMQVVRAGEPAPCLSKRSVLSLGDRVVFASTHGLVSVSESGVELMTKDVYDYLQWRGLSPENMQCAYANGRVHVLTKVDAQTRWLVFDMRNGNLTESGIDADVLYTHPLTGELFFAKGKDIYLFDSKAGTLLVQAWQSKRFDLPQPVNFGAARVKFNDVIDPAIAAAAQAEASAAAAANVTLLATGKIRGAWNARAFNAKHWNGSDLQYVPDTDAFATGVTFDLYADGDLKHSRLVTNEQPFRLPSGYMSEAYSVRVTSQSRVRSVEVAETIGGLNAS